jgi:Zn-dependent peptidase ImmA (M78 family)
MTSRTVRSPQQEAARILAQFKTTKPPVPIEKIARGLGAHIRFSPLDDEISGMIYIKDGVPIIGVNSLHGPNRQRFTMAHEIGHLILHRDLMSKEVHVDKQFQILRRDYNSASGSERIEIQANQFAAELMMPRELLRQAIGPQAIDIDDSAQLKRLALKFKVSEDAMRYRVTNLFLLR